MRINQRIGDRDQPGEGNARIYIAGKNAPGGEVSAVRESTEADRFNVWRLVLPLAAAIFLGLGVLDLTRNLSRLIFLVIIGLAVAAALEPVVIWMEKKLSRVLAVVLIFVALVLIIAGFGWFVIPPFVEQVRSLAIRLPAIVAGMRDWLEQFPWLDAGTVVSTLLNSTSQIGSFVTAIPASVLNSLLDIVLVIFIALYSLLLIPTMRRFVTSLFPGSDRHGIASLIGNMSGAMGGYLRGVAINGLIFGTAEYIGLMVIGVPYALALGVFAAVMELFPFVGAVISGAFATLVALTISVETALITLAFILILQQLENNILVPLVMRSQTEIPALLVILAVAAGAILGGVLGAVAAIPLAGAMLVLVNDLIAPAIRRSNGVAQDADNGGDPEHNPQTGKSAG